MGSEWREMTLGEIIDFKPKRTIKKGTTAPFVAMSDVLENCRDIINVHERKYSGGGSRFANGDTLFARITPCLENGKTVKVSGIPNDDIAHGSTEFIVMNAKLPDYDECFVYYLARFPGFRKFAESRMEGTSGRQRVSWQSLENFSIDLPAPSIRKRIGSILASLDDKIELNRQMNATLEGMAQALFKSWFSDFDPVIDNILMKNSDRILSLKPSPPTPLPEGEGSFSSPLTRSSSPRSPFLAGADLGEGSIDDGLFDGLFDGIPDVFRARAETRLRVITGKGEAPASSNSADAAGATSLPENNRHLFPAAFQFTEEMGWIPEGWEVSTIGKETKSVGGGTPSTKNSVFWENGHINWTTPKDLSNKSSKILLDTDRKITEEGLRKINSGLLPVDTVLMSSRAPVGYLALAKVPVAINQGYIAMKCTKKLNSEYVLQWADSVMDDIKQRAGGTTFAEISKTNFRGIPVIVPDSCALEKYSQAVGGFYDKITKNLQESTQLEKLRDTLLPKLISGELRVGDAGEMMEEAK